MACNSPLKGFQVGLTENGKPNYKIVPYRAKGVYQTSKGSKWYIDYYSGQSLSAYRYVSQYIDIPCGKCLECRLSKSRQWADRCMLELPYHDYNYFVTLTYDDEHIHLVDGINPETGEKARSPTLRKKDLQDFFKRLRSRLSYLSDTIPEKSEFYGHIKDFQYLASCEYGKKSMRPHYHFIGFDLPLDDLVVEEVTETGTYYSSKLISELWPYGIHRIASVTWETCAYVARYTAKKLHNDMKVYYHFLNIEEESLLSSKRPALGKKYYQDHKDKLYSQAFTSLPTQNGGVRIYPPRYVDKLLEADDPDKLLQIKEERKFFGQQNDDLRHMQTTLDKVDRLHAKEEVLGKRLKSLSRDKV